MADRRVTRDVALRDAALREAEPRDDVLRAAVERVVRVGRAAGFAAREEDFFLAGMAPKVTVRAARPQAAPCRAARIPPPPSEIPPFRVS